MSTSPHLHTGATDAREVPSAAPPAPTSRAAPPSRARRAAVAAALGAICGLLAWALARQAAGPRDIDQVWFAVRALLAGRDPYPLIGPGREFDWPWPFYYPLPAALALAPLAPLGQVAARVAFVAVGCGLLAYTTTRGGFHRLPLFASYCLLNAVRNAQWSPLLTAASLLPPAAGLLFAAKPNLGLAFLLASRSTRRALLAGAAALAFALVAVAVQPGWPREWLATLHDAPQVVAAVARPGGALLLLALLRWRRPDARLLLALSCVPQTGMWYEAVPLFLIAETRLQALTLAVLSWAAYLSTAFVVPAGADFTSGSHIVGTLMVVCLYLPCLVMVLRRPNEGEVPLLWPRRLRRPARAGREG